MVSNQNSKLNSVVFHVFSCLLGFIMVYPLLWLLMSSFKSSETMFQDAWSLIPKSWDALTNYASGWKGVAGVGFWTFFKNSAIVTVASVTGSIFCSLLAAYAVCRVNFRGANFWFGCILMTMMIPSQVLVPVVQPAIVTASIFAFYWTWQDFFQPLIFVSSPKNFTIPLALNMYLDPNSYNNYGGLFAMSVVSLLPGILIFIKFQKYLVEGIATEGIKG